MDEDVQAASQLAQLLISLSILLVIARLWFQSYCETHRESDSPPARKDTE